MDFTGAVAPGALKTLTISAAHLGYKAFSAWKFTKSFAEFMAEKIQTNKGLFEFPEDVHDFEGPNGEHEVSMTLIRKTFITVQFPSANPIPRPSPVNKPAPKKYIFTYTDDVAEEPEEQDQEHPVKAKLNWNNPLKGVSEYYIISGNYKFISDDGTRSVLGDSACDPNKWKDYIIPEGKQIRKVETLIYKGSGFLYGFKWIGDDGGVLLKVGYIDNPDLRDDSDSVVTQLTLNQNQRLVGVKSASGGRKREFHWSF